MTNGADRPLGLALAALGASTVASAAHAQDADALFETGAVYVEADEVIDDRENGRYIARGAVEARYGARILRADELIYFPELARAVARGNVTVVQPDGSVTFADEAEFAEDLEVGVVTNFSARLPNNASLGAAVAVRRAGDANELERAFYTACTVCEAADGEEVAPTWRLRARRVRQDLDNEFIYYRDAVLEVKGVPVLYLPYFAHADPNSRARSGFLLPTFGESSATGSFVETPYYWALTDYQDITLSPRFMSNAEPLLSFEHRKRFFSGETRFQGSFTNEQEFNDDGEKFGDKSFRGHLFGQGAFRINDAWLWGFGLETVSDDLYFRRYDIDDEDAQRGLYRRGDQRLLTQAFAQRRGRDSYISVAALRFQGLQASDSEGALPFVLPLFEARKLLDSPIFGGRIETRATSAFVRRDEDFDSYRVSTEVDWKRRTVTRSGFVTTGFALARGDVYYVTDFLSPDGEIVDEETIARALAHVGGELSLPLGRSIGSANIILEPTVRVTAAPTGGNDDRIPNQDSVTADFDDASFLEANRATGYDVWEDGLRATVGGRALARFAGGQELSGFFGQSYRADPVDYFSSASGLNETSSDYIGAVTFKPLRTTSLTSRFRLDNEDFDVQRLDLDLTSRMGPAQIQARYQRFTEQPGSTRPDEELKFYAGLELTDHFGVYYDATRDLEADETRLAFLGLVYDDDCTRVELVYKQERTQDREIGSNNSIRLQVTLNTIGSFGNNR